MHRETASGPCMLLMQSFSKMAIWESVNLGKGCIAYRCGSMWIFSLWILLVTQVDSLEGLDCPMSPVMANNSDIVTWSVPVVNSSSPVHLASTHQPGGYFRLGETHNVTYTATITATNGTTTTETCSFTVIINPDGSPVITSCPDDKRYETLPASFWTDSRNIPTAEGCGQSSGDCLTTISPRTGSDFRLGTTRVTYRFTNTTLGLTSRCSFKVTIEGVSNNIVELSTRNCPPDPTPVVLVPRGTNFTEVSWTEPVFTDAVGNVLPSLVTKPPGSEFRRGSTEVLYVAMDSNFNRALCVFNVTVIVDDIPPEVQCPENITQYVRENVAELEVHWPPPNATDNNGAVTMTVRPESGTFFQASIGGQMDKVVVNVYDGYGNSADCSFFVNIISDTRPQVECEDIITDTLPGEAYANVTWPNVNITDDYTPLPMLVVDSTHRSGMGVRYNNLVVVKITVRDESKNEGTCTFNINVQDNERPEWKDCPHNITREATPGSNQAQVEWDSPTVTDNSGDTLIIRGPHNSLLFTAGTHLIEYTATDRAGNSANCEFNVTVTVDSTVPVFTVPCDDLSFNTEPEGSNSAFVTWDERTAMDDDSIPTITGNYASGQRLTIGSYDIEYRAVDESGNVAYCRFTVTVVDGESPQFTFCPEDVNVNFLATKDTVLVRWTLPIATDNSGSVQVTPMDGSIPSESRFTNGTYIIPYTAEDPAGNTATSCMVSLEVAVKSDTIRIRGEIILDTVRGLNGAFDESSAQLDNLESDLDDYFRYLNALTDYFVGIVIVPGSLSFNNPGSNAKIDFDLYLCDPSHTNEAEIEDAFTSILSLTDSFPTANRVVQGSLDLLVKEFRGEFTLLRIDNTNNLDFDQCCANPLNDDYKMLKDRLNRQLDFMFMEMTGFLMVSVVRFDPGSVVVTFSVTFDRSSSATVENIANEFELNVVDDTLELRFGSNLFLADSAPVINVTEVCPDTTPCRNGGSCTVNVSTFHYTCTCPSGYTGRYCDDVVQLSVTLTTGAIIGIVAGVVGFFLILTSFCCCYFIYATRVQTKRWGGELAVREYDRERQHGALLPMITMEDPYTRRSHIYGDRGYDNRAGPVITEIENEGPVFHHDYATERNALPSPSPSPPPPFVEPFRPPIPIPSETVLAPRFGHEYWDADCYLRPSSTTQPGAVYHPPPPGYDGVRRAYFQTIRDGFSRSRHRRYENVGPHFLGDARPEEVGEMKRRLFHEFNY